MKMVKAIWLLTALVCIAVIYDGCSRAHGDSVEIKFQTAPDGRQCYLGFQNGELKGMSCP